MKKGASAFYHPVRPRLNGSLDSELGKTNHSFSNHSEHERGPHFVRQKNKRKQKAKQYLSNLVESLILKKRRRKLVRKIRVKIAVFVVGKKNPKETDFRFELSEKLRN